MEGASLWHWGKEIYRRKEAYEEMVKTAMGYAPADPGKEHTIE